MIVPDKQTETYLNLPARSENVIRLCRAGILSPSDFLRAVALCRSEKKWGQAGRFILSVMLFLSLTAATLFFVLSGWFFFYTMQGGVFLAILFVACSFFRHFAMADYIGAGLIGAMIFFPDMIFGTNAFLYEQFLLWFFLSVLWGVFSSRTEMRLLPLALLNITVALYGFRFVLPSFRMRADNFCALIAMMNLFLLFLWEKKGKFFPFFRSSAFRFSLLLFAGLFLLSGAVMQSLFHNGNLAFLYCFVFTLITSGAYLLKKEDAMLCRLLLVFSFLWIGLLIYWPFGSTVFSGGFRTALFFCAESLLPVSALILDRRLNKGDIANVD